MAQIIDLSQRENVDFWVRRGRTETPTLTITEDDGTVSDLTGRAVVAVSAIPSIASISASATNAPGGEVTLTIVGGSAVGRVAYTFSVSSEIWFEGEIEVRA